MKVGDLVKLSAKEEDTLARDLGIDREEIQSDWEYGIVVEVCSNHGNDPFYQVHWTPVNEVFEETIYSIVRLD